MRRHSTAGPVRAFPLLLAALVPACAPGSADTAASRGGVPGSAAAATAASAPGGRIDAERMLETVRYLADDARRGRRTGTPGNEAARAYIVEAFRRVGLTPVAGGYTHPFTFTGRRDGSEYRGVNILGTIEGRVRPDRYIVITAHYDHVGVGKPDATGDSIYNGADDNASGTAALLALAAYFHAHAPANSMLFAALDAEEMGLRGARALVADPPVPLDDVVIDVNMDMVSRNARGELYVAGTYHYPFLAPLVERIAAGASVTLLPGHDRPGLPPGDDWTSASDHGAFHAAGIPFLYFGVEDHPDYHRPSDEVAKIDPDFYARAVETILDVVLALDADLDAVAAQRGVE
ncbi:MAG TPA: M28 family peptidase [Longimicrobiales bacterium]